MVHRIVVPFELPDPEPLSPTLVDDLSTMEVVVLGYYGLPEQTPPDAAREQFEEAAEATLDDLAAPFERAGATVTTRLVFGKDRAKTIDRIALEEGCDAELDPAPTGGVERILVPLIDRTNLARLTDFVAALCEETTTAVTLFHVAEGDEDADTAEAMLRSAREEMIEQGIDPGLIDTAVVESEEHDDEILRLAAEYDAVVMDEAAPDIGERIFGTLSDRIADRTGDPVVIVRRNVGETEGES